MNGIQKSTSFLLPTVYEEAGVAGTNLMVAAGLKNTYMLDTINFPTEVWGQYLYAIFPSDTLNNIAGIKQELMNLSTYCTSYSLDGTNDTVMKFEIPEKLRTSVVDPFIKGKYSLIDSDYRLLYFPAFIKVEGNFVESMNYKILIKSPTLKAQWELALDTTLPPDAEVWSIVEKEDEDLKTYIKNHESIKQS